MSPPVEAFTSLRSMLNSTVLAASRIFCLGGEDDFRGFKGIYHDDFLRIVHHLGRNNETEAAEFGKVKAHVHFESISGYIVKP